MDTMTATTVIGTGVVVAGAAASAAGVFLKRSRRRDQFREDWEGQPARNGFDAIPGVPERVKTMEGVLQQILAQLKPNGGSSLRDSLNRVELSQHRSGIDHAILVRRLDAHQNQIAPMLSELTELRREMTEIQKIRDELPPTPPPSPPE